VVRQPHEWKALRDARAALRVIDWKCADHGATTNTEFELEAARKGIRVVSSIDECEREPWKVIRVEKK